MGVLLALVEALSVVVLNVLGVALVTSLGEACAARNLGISGHFDGLLGRKIGMGKGWFVVIELRIWLVMKNKGRDALPL